MEMEAGQTSNLLTTEDYTINCLWDRLQQTEVRWVQAAKVSRQSE